MEHLTSKVKKSTEIENFRLKSKRGDDDDLGGNMIEEIKIEEAKWAKDVIIERNHEIQEERDLIAVLRRRPTITVMKSVTSALSN